MTPHPIILVAQTVDGRHTTKRLPHVRRFIGYTIRRHEDEPGPVTVDFYDARTGALCDTITLWDSRPDESVEWSTPFALHDGLWVEATGIVVGSVFQE